MGDSVIYYVEQADEPVNRAGERARKTFKYFGASFFGNADALFPPWILLWSKSLFSKTAKTAKFANICGSTIFILTVFIFTVC